MIMLLNMSYSEGDMTGFSVVGRKCKVVISLPNITVYIVVMCDITIFITIRYRYDIYDYMPIRYDINNF